MAVISCHRLSEQKTTQESVNGLSHELQWLIVTNSSDHVAGEGTLRVLSLATSVGPHPLPAYGAVYSYGQDVDAVSICVHREAVRNPKRRNEFRATCRFERPKPGEQPEETTQTDPLQRPIRYRMEHEHWTRVVDKDKDGAAIKNSAGVPFDSGLELEDSMAVLIAEKNFATLQQIIDLNTTYSMKVNSDNFKGKPARSWLCRPITCSDLQEENNIQYYKGTFHVVHKPDLWDVEVVDKGFAELVGGQLKDILDLNKQPISEPWPLNGAGAKLPVGQPLVLRNFRLRSEVAFSGLGV